MDIFFSFIVYLPFVSLLVSLVFFAIYGYLRHKKKVIRKSLLIIAFVGIGIFCIYFGFFFLIGLLGIGPVPN